MPIVIDITTLLKSVGNKIGVVEEENISYPNDNLILTAPVAISGEFVNTGSFIVFRGNIKTKVLLNCARCLNDFDYPIDINIEEEYSREPLKVSKKEEYQLKDKDFMFEVEPNNTINLSEAVRQNLITMLPISPLCATLCKG